MLDKLEKCKKCEALQIVLDTLKSSKDTHIIRLGKSNGVNGGESLEKKYKDRKPPVKSVTTVSLEDLVSEDDTPMSKESVFCHELMHAFQYDQDLMTDEVNDDDVPVTEENAVRLANEYRESVKEAIRKTYGYADYNTERPGNINNPTAIPDLGKLTPKPKKP